MPADFPVSAAWQPAISSPFTPRFFIRILLTFAFFISLMQYWVHVANGGILGIAAVYVAGFVVLLARERVDKLSRLFSGGIFIILSAILSEVVSYFTSETFSIQYGLILIGLLVMARLIILQISFVEVVRCYLYSAILCTLIILVAGRKELSDYQAGSTRFAGGANAHPNLLGFTLASYLPLFIGLALELPRGKKRLFIGALAVITVVLLFTTGSRGSLGAVVVAALITILRFTVVNPLVGRLRLSPLQVVLTLVAIGAGIYFLFRGSHLTAFAGFVVQALQLNSQYRGIHSGFSGRTFLWLLAIHRLHGLQWLFGAGFRQPVLIDSGYVTVLYENGIVGGAVILGTILRLGYWLWRSTSRIESVGWWRYNLVLWNLIIIYLVNNFTTRYLYAYGNQFSLLMIFMLLCQRSQLVGKVTAASATPKNVRAGSRQVWRLGSDAGTQQAG